MIVQNTAQKIETRVDYARNAGCLGGRLIYNFVGLNQNMRVWTPNCG